MCPVIHVLYIIHCQSSCLYCRMCTHLLSVSVESSCLYCRMCTHLLSVSVESSCLYCRMCTHLLSVSCTFLYALSTDSPILDRVSLSSLSPIENETVTLQATLVGADPPPEDYTWRFNNQPLSSSQRHSFSEDMLNLTISMVTAVDSGTYTVEASNVIGTGNAVEFELNVLGQLAWGLCSIGNQGLNICILVLSSSL